MKLKTANLFFLTFSLIVTFNTTTQAQLGRRLVKKLNSAIEGTKTTSSDQKRDNYSKRITEPYQITFSNKPDDDLNKDNNTYIEEYIFGDNLFVLSHHGENPDEYNTIDLEYSKYGLDVRDGRYRIHKWPYYRLSLNGTEIKWYNDISIRYAVFRGIQFTKRPIKGADIKSFLEASRELYIQAYEDGNLVPGKLDLKVEIVLTHIPKKDQEIVFAEGTIPVIITKEAIDDAIKGPFLSFPKSKMDDEKLIKEIITLGQEFIDSNYWDYEVVDASIELNAWDVYKHPETGQILTRWLPTTLKLKDTKGKFYRLSYDVYQSHLGGGKFDVTTQDQDRLGKGKEKKIKRIICEN
ncbi:hypothetical protein KMW28_28055 [Flammeovirga yaeyamensis]|uniref:Uncharacterized protein n=1 Tax=Flammeovirga yaeyamensis TaxID=367791 RepID=A0AAX1NB54_9BACT|nr:hypothetical protein [Flammeovirga yaeyamensis]MBB3699858.1 hypothetical protein [Flammeovirga yaeyamensis]NMF38345.1 hypothetical protein [Flammeovirga yaeyamensis]QWG04756.1 hypothetical protein KMW28_28055 [Flammeovirga yaeyamensis]